MNKKVLFAFGMSVVVALSVVTPVLAWHPKGEITKQVQNVTTGSALGETINAKPGDIVKYVITISNVAKPAANEYNDMYYTVMEDKLPAGVELVSNASKRVIKEDIGRLQPGQKTVKEYQVTVTATKDGTITNTACYEGDSKVRDNKQADCDGADIKVTVPKTPEKPVEPPKEEPKKEIKAAEIVIPATGPEALALGGLSLAGVGYSASAYLRSKRELVRAHKR